MSLGTFYLRDASSRLSRYHDPEGGQASVLLAATLFARNLSPLEETAELKAEWERQNARTSELPNVKAQLDYEVTGGEAKES